MNPTNYNERLQTAKEFLESFYDPAARVSLICNFDTETEGKPFAKQGKVSSLIRSLPKYIETATALSLNYMDGHGAKAENVETLNLCWVEIDDLALKKLKSPFPHRVYSRDSTHHYLYWKLEPVEASEENRALQLAINTKLQKMYEGDPASRDVARRLRMPGSFHPDGDFYKFQEQLSKPAIAPYSLEELAKALKISLPAMSASNTTNAKNSATPATPATSEPASEAELLTEIKHMLSKAFPETVKGDGRSRKLFLLGIDCHDWGIPQAAALQLAHDINLAKCKPPEDQKTLEHQIESAYRYAKNAFGELLRDYEQAKDRKKAQQKFIEEQEVRDLLESFVYVRDAERMVNLKNWNEWTTISQIETSLTSITRKRIALKPILQRGLVRALDSLDFLPGKDRFVFQNETEILNRFCPLAIKPLPKKATNKKAVDVFLEHLDYLATSPEEYKTLLNYIAWNVQRPGEKTMFATLIISHSTGIGKSLLERFFRNIFQAKTGQNYVTTIENHQLTSPYTEYMKDRLVGFVHELGEYDRYNLMFRLKDLITGEYISINEKYARPFQVRNTVNFFFFSNLKNAIRLDEQDRRLFVIYNEKAPKPREYYETLVSVIDNEYESIYTHLMDLDLSQFSPFERPAMTAGKKQLIDLGKSELAIYLESLRDRSAAGFERGYFTIHDLIDFIEMQGPATIKYKVSQKALSIWLSENGFVTTRKVGRDSGQRKTWWHLPDVELPDEPDILYTDSEENAEAREF